MELILLHGAIGAAEQLNDIANHFEKKHTVHTLDFSGHGASNATNEHFSIARFAIDVITYMKQKSITKATFIGYSMGGYVAFYIAQHYPEKVEKIVTLATKFNWDVEIAQKEILMLQADRIEAKLPAFAHTLKKRHQHNDWKVVLQKTTAMLLEMGNNNPLKLNDYTTIAHPCLVMLGDRDKMVTLDETVAVYKTLPAAQLCILPSTTHPIEQLNVNMFASIVEQFI